MYGWSDTYDDETVRTAARRSANGMMVRFALVSGALVALAPVSTLLVPSMGLILPAACLLVLVVHAGILAVRLRRVHNVVWRIEMSIHGVTLIEAGGLRRRSAWQQVERVDVRTCGIEVVLRPEARRAAGRMLVPESFRGHAALARRLLDYAEATNVAVWVEGQPWQEVGLAAVYESLKTPPRRPA
jgi:hypothetical protein